MFIFHPRGFSSLCWIDWITDQRVFKRERGTISMLLLMLRYRTLRIVSCYYRNAILLISVLDCELWLPLHGFRYCYICIFFSRRKQHAYRIASKRKHISEIYVASFVFHERSFPAILYIRNILTVVRSKRRTYHNFHCILFNYIIR